MRPLLVIVVPPSENGVARAGRIESTPSRTGPTRSSGARRRLNLFAGRQPSRNDAASSASLGIIILKWLPSKLSKSEQKAERSSPPAWTRSTETAQPGRDARNRHRPGPAPAWTRRFAVLLQQALPLRRGNAGARIGKFGAQRPAIPDGDIDQPRFGGAISAPSG